VMDIGDNIVGLVAVIMVFSIVLVPIIGLTARFALKPTMEAMSQFFQQKGVEETVRILERRLGLLEQQVEHMEGQLEQVAEVQRFDRQLGVGPGTGSGPEGDPGRG
jgi:hypothetical protein